MSEKKEYGSDYIDDGTLCVCGHKDGEHYNDGGDYTANVSCEAGLNDGSLCPCSDFTERNFEAGL